jgi:hypothetical protein
MTIRTVTGPLEGRGVNENTISNLRIITIKRPVDPNA